MRIQNTDFLETIKTANDFLLSIVDTLRLSRYGIEWVNFFDATKRICGVEFALNLLRRIS